MTMLTLSALRWMEEQRKRAVLRRLLDHDDRTLEDIGLTRIETEIALELPMSESAGTVAHAASHRSLAMDRRAPADPAPGRMTHRVHGVAKARQPGWLLRFWQGVFRPA